MQAASLPAPCGPQRQGMKRLCDDAREMQFFAPSVMIMMKEEKVVRTAESARLREDCLRKG